MALWYQEIVKNIPLLFYSIAVVLHSIGIMLLTKVRRRRNQDLIILHLSVSELFMCLLDIAQNILMRDRYMRRSTEVAIAYVIIVNCCFFVVPSFLIIITLTVDRLLEVLLNIKYQLYFTKFTVKVVLASNWMFGAALGAILISMKMTHGTKVRLFIFMIVFPVLQSIFLVLAFITYGYIYKKFRKKFKSHFLGKVAPTAQTDSKVNSESVTTTDSNDNNENTKTNLEIVEYGSQNSFEEITKKKERNTRTYPLWKVHFGHAKRVVVLTLSSTTCKDNNNNQNKNKQKKPSVFQKRNFFAPTLILFTFILFVLIPDTFNLFFHYMETIKWSEDTQNILLCFYSLGFIMDGLIYIFLQKHLRNMLLKVCSRSKWAQKHVSSPEDF
jgi:hypothetical protein